MSMTVQTLLMIGPLAGYFLLQGLWHRGPGPQVVSGQHDFSALALALGALICFGPVGEALVGFAPARADLAARIVLLAALWLIVLLVAPASYRRLLVYNAEPADVDFALEETLRDEVPGDFLRTIRGFEDPRSRRGLHVTYHPHTGGGEIEFYGAASQALQAAVAAGLRHRLAGRTSSQGRPLASLLYLLSVLTLSLPLLLTWCDRPNPLEALRVMLRSLIGA
jgi:hypothetical protein